MGVFDTVNCGKFEIQVKTWDRAMKWYEMGDVVPDIQGVESYAILDPSSGWYLIVMNLRLIKAQREHPALPTFNKWGEKIW